MASKHCVFVLVGPSVGKSLSIGNLRFVDGIHQAIYDENLQLPGIKNIMSFNSAKLLENLTDEERAAHIHAVSPASAVDETEASDAASKGSSDVSGEAKEGDQADAGSGDGDADAGRKGSVAPVKNSADVAALKSAATEQAERNMKSIPARVDARGSASGPPNKVTPGVTLERVEGGTDDEDSNDLFDLV